LVASALLALAAGCKVPGGAAVGDARDAAVASTTAAVSSAATAATWNNLWGSWPLVRYDHGAAYDSDRKVMVVFGGRQSSQGPYYEDTWEWDGTRGAWNERTPPASADPNNPSSPQLRAEPLMVYDTVRKKTFLYSGWQPAAAFYLQDQWEWDGAAQTWTNVIATSTAQPTARYGGAMVWDSDRKRALLFGGFCSDNSGTGARCADTWEWDGTTKTWTNRTPAAASASPSPRMYHTMVYDSARKKTLLYGGYTGTGAATTGTWVDETWEWDGTAGTWTKIVVAAGIPQYSGDVHIAFDAGRGKTVAFYYVGYVWEYDPTTPTWNKVTDTNTSTTDYPGYYYESFLYDTSRAVIIAFGGQNGYPRDLFEYDGTAMTWTNRSVPVNGPIQRQYPMIAFDSMRGKLMLFGGYSNVDSLYKQDIWQWSGTDATWTNLTNANPKPAGRYQGGLVYDSKRDQLILFGGVGSTYYNDVWTWSPTTKNWTPQTITGTQPSATYGFPMFYDSARDKVVVYINYYTVWDLDPATWTWTSRIASSSAVPTAFTQRGNFEVAFDTDRDKLLFIGGYGPASVYDADVWEWDAKTTIYTERPPAAGASAPVGRYQHGVSYDSNRKVVVQFGGYASVSGVATGAQDDSWEWDGIAGAWTDTTALGAKPLPRYNHLQVFNPQTGTTLVFGGTVPADSTYGPQEIWEYEPNSAKRPNGSGCSVAAASSCASGACVDGVCCSTASCATTCQACNVPGSLGTCAYVPAGSPDDSCAAGQACNAAHQCKAQIAATCSSYTDCASGHCSDGVCCDTDCNDTCKSCNLPGKVGACSLVPTGNEDPPTCASDTNQPRYCDATGVCNNAGKPTGTPCTTAGQCGSGNCVDGVCCSTACTQTCYQCNTTGSVGTCLPIAAGLPDHSAATTCDGAMQYCTGSGTCGANKKPNGAACTAATDCGSGFCVDSTCCNGACLGTCQACNVPGQLGACVNVPPGNQDTNATTACGGSQYCDASGTCQSGKKPNGAVCAAAADCGSNFCVDGVCCNATCADNCYACNLVGSVGTCTGVPTGTADQCASPNYCDANHTCTAGKKPNGAVCTLDTDCASSLCVDGVCCDSACSGTCRSCKVTGSVGTCTLVPSGMDPRGSCKGTLPGSDACAGTCDGAGACKFSNLGVACSTAGCAADGYIRLAGACDGAGNCYAPPDSTKNCNGFACYTDPATSMAKCRTDCTTDPECASKFYCQSGADGGTDAGGSSSCPSAFPLGHACDRNAQCLSGTCSDGVCCNINCDQCGSCNLVGSVGTCMPVPAGTDPNGDCIYSASDPSGKCGGTCDGHARCVFPAAGSTCGLCSTCDGAGKCNVKPDDDTACNTIACSGLNAASNCVHYNDIKTNRCASLGTCKPANTAATCTDVVDMCGADAGTDSGTDGGTHKGGGGGCGCEYGGAGQGGLLSVLLAAAGISVRRRRRR
jgi:hypothetical protein